MLCGSTQPFNVRRMLDQALSPLVSAGWPAEWKQLQDRLDAAFIDAALRATGTATLRRRRLPAEQVVWLVIAMGLFRDRSIERVVASLDLALPGVSDLPAKSGIAQARERVGAEPLRALLHMSGGHWAATSARKHAWRGLGIYAYDGTTLPVPDTPENRKEFGGQWSGPKGPSGYPIVRAVALMSLRARVIASMRVGSYETGETTLAADLWRDVPDNSLVIVDRGLMVATDLIQLAQAGNRHWVARPKSKRTKWKVVAKLGPSDELVELPTSWRALRSLPGLAEVWTVRAIHYLVKGEKRTLLTSLLDAERYPAKELIELYRERWEQELAYDEVKTHLLNREETIRSRTPENVRQEIYGIAIAYNLIRLEMERTADELNLPPTRISFVAAVQLVRDECLWCSNSTPGAIPKQLAKLRNNMKYYVLPARRPGRSFPRAVKVRATRFPKKAVTSIAN
jgi:hypothetical protein